MGGTNERSNLVRLTAREHFIAHWLLWKIHRTSKMACAFFMMTKNRSHEHVINSRQFEYARYAFSQAISRLKKGQIAPNKGKPHKDSTKAKISKANTGRKPPPRTKEYCEKIAASKRGKKRGELSAEWKANLSKSLTGRQHSLETIAKMKTARAMQPSPSAETRAKIAATLRGRKVENPRKLTCPHCQFFGGVSALKRYHFDNCKQRPKG
jgi:hypothetical protein